MVDPQGGTPARAATGVTSPLPPAGEPSVLLRWTDRQWSCEAANPPWRALTGSSVEQLTGAPIGALLPDRFVAEALGRLCDLAVLMATGRRMSTPPIAGSPRVAMVVPLTSRERVVRVALTLAPSNGHPPSREEMGRALEASVLVFDREHRVIAADGAAALTSGVRGEEILGRTNRELGYPRDLVDLWDAHVETVFDTGAPTVVSFTLPTVLGPRVYESNGEPVLDVAGDVQAVRVTSRDVTRERLAHVPVQGWHAEHEPVVVALWEGFEPTPGAVAEARRAVRGWLVDTSLASVADEVLLAVSELATNAAMHAGTTFFVHAQHSAGVVRIGVHDGSVTLPQVRAAGRAGGRGLGLVESVSTSWGADPLPGVGKVVWCAFVEAHRSGAVQVPAVDAPQMTAEELIDFWAD